MKIKHILFIMLFFFPIIANSQNLSFRTSLLRPWWTPPADVYTNPDFTSKITNRGYKIFDYNIGLCFDYKIKKYTCSVQSSYEINTVRTTAHHFLKNSEINRFYSLYFWHNQFRVSREAFIHKRKLDIGVGFDLDVRIKQKRTMENIQLSYTPIPGFDPQDQGYEKFNLILGFGGKRLITGMHIEARTEIGKLLKRNVFLYLNTSYSFENVLIYSWAFKNEIFASRRGNRLTPRIGIQMMIFKNK